LGPAGLSLGGFIFGFGTEKKFGEKKGGPEKKGDIGTFGLQLGFIIFLSLTLNYPL
jgi:hypothetical protein